MTSDGDKLKNKIWKPDILFFRKGKADFYNPFTHRTETIRWTIKHIKKHNYPITVTHCAFDGVGVKGDGFGDGIFLKHSIMQSFAEGWERLWMRYLNGRDDTLFPILNSSNGYAAGRTSEEALNRAESELIERALFLEAWQKQRGWHPYELRCIRSKILCAILKTQGWQTKFFLFSDKNLGSVLGGWIQHESLGSVFDAAYLAKQSSAIVELKLCRSLIRCSPVKKIGDGLPWVLPDEGVPQEHAKFYANPKNKEAFVFLNDPKSAEGTFNFPNPSKIISKIIVAPSAFPAVAVSYHPEWPKLCWGKQSIAGENPWPHPLA